MTQEQIIVEAEAFRKAHQTVREIAAAIPDDDKRQRRTKQMRYVLQLCWERRIDPSGIDIGDPITASTFIDRLKQMEPSTVLPPSRVKALADTCAAIGEPLPEVKNRAELSTALRKAQAKAYKEGIGQNAEVDSYIQTNHFA